MPIAIAALFLAIAVSAASAKSRKGSEDEMSLRPAGPPVMAIVALRQQRVTIYDAEGRVMSAPVSSGQTGYETPAGIYSVLEKNREHYSNLYDDASMPFMQRITWSGIALHAGILPGRPASHGCIRMPHAFAERLFGMTKLGLRVVVVRDDMRPVAFSHPALFKPGPIVSQVASSEQSDGTAAGKAEPVSMHLGAPPADAGVERAQTWRAFAAAKRAQAQAAASAAEKARAAVVKANGETARIAKAQRMAERSKRKAEDQLEDIEKEIARAGEDISDQKKATLEADRVRATTRLEEAKAALAAIEAESTAKIAELAAAREAAKTAAEAKDTAAKEARLAEAKTAPVSVFISRKTKRLYVRQGFQPVLESDVTIRDPDAPIGTFIFTALDYTGSDASDLSWTALAMYDNPTDPGVGERSGHTHEAGATDVAAARAALDRISIPQDTLDRIREVASPGSSLIVSDESLSRETGKGTDFVVLMSGEPQGGIKIRRRDSGDAGYRRRFPDGENGYRRTYPTSPFFGNGPFGWW